MASPPGTSAGAPPPTEEDVRAQHNAIRDQLKDGKLRGKVKVVLILGYAGAGKSNLLKLITGNPIQIGHNAEHGTVDALFQFAKLGTGWFVFIDTPGFGTAGYSFSRVRSTIRGTLGIATRCFGGIHGILYVHNIETDRTYTGVKESLEFLRELQKDNCLPALTFITTKWDRVHDEERQIYLDRAQNLRSTSWREFNSYSYFQVGCNYDYSQPERRQTARTTLMAQLADRYSRANSIPVNMPFWEWTWGEIGVGAAKCVWVPVGGSLWAVGFVLDEAIKEVMKGNIDIGVNSDGIYVGYGR